MILGKRVRVLFSLQTLRIQGDYNLRNRLLFFMTKTNQYERPNIVHLFASLPHAGHFVLPGSIAGYEDWSNGIHNDFAPALGARSSCGSEARPLRSLMSSSHASTSHQGKTTTHLLSSVGTTSSQFVMTFRREL